MIGLKKPAGEMLELKSRAEMDQMRAAGRIVHEVLSTISAMVRPGVTLKELSQAADAIIDRHGATAMFKGYPSPDGKGAPFPAPICASVNDEIVHGIPGGRVLNEGDIVSLDCGVRLNGWCADSAVTVGVGRISERHQLLLDVTRGALKIAIETARVDGWWSEVARKMQQAVEAAGFHVVREYVGHGIGRRMHEPPKVPNYYSRELKSDDIRLRKGLVLAVEPMVNVGTKNTKVLNDHWTVVTEDRSFSAHFEHTLAFNQDGAVEVLTDGK
jgi:methionyl aminopeptidase